MRKSRRRARERHLCVTSARQAPGTLWGCVCPIRRWSPPRCSRRRPPRPGVRGNVRRRAGGSECRGVRPDRSRLGPCAPGAASAGAPLGAPGPLRARASRRGVRAHALLLEFSPSRRARGATHSLMMIGRMDRGQDRSSGRRSPRAIDAVRRARRQPAARTRRRSPSPGAEQSAGVGVRMNGFLQGRSNCHPNVISGSPCATGAQIRWRRIGRGPCLGGGGGSSERQASPTAMPSAPGNRGLSHPLGPRDPRGGSWGDRIP